MPEEEDTVAPEVYEHISRGALWAGIALSVAYMISGIVIFLITNPNDKSLEWAIYTAAVLPLIVSAIMGGHQLWLKWVRYTMNDRHMQVALTGIILSATMTVLAYFWLLQFKTAYVFFFPVAQLCVTLVMIGYPLTHSHKFSLLSSAVALVPMFLFSVIAMYGAFANVVDKVGFGAPLLAILYFFSGNLMILAGSLHHMGTISTSFVRVERIIDVDESEIKALQKDIGKRDDELKGIEKFAGSLKGVTLENYKTQLHGLEGDTAALVAVKLGALSLVQNIKTTMQDQTVSIREVERLTAKEKMLQQKETELITREKNMADKLGELSQKSSTATIKEMEIKKKEDALAIREMDVAAKERDATAKEESAKKALAEAETKYEVAKKESESLKERELAVASAKRELEAREAQVKSKEEQLIKGSSNLVTQKDGLKAREDALAKREQEIKVREEAVSLKDRELSSMPYDDMKRMKDEITVKETENRNKESEISLLRAKLDEAQKSLQARADELRSTKIEYDASLSKLKAKEEVIAKKDEELQILRVKIETRERDLSIRESEFDKKAGPVHSHARAEERAHKLIERLKMSKEMDEKMETQKAEGLSNEMPAVTPPSEPEVRPQPQTVAQTPSPVPEHRPSIPPFMVPKPKDPIPQPAAPQPPVPEAKVQPQPAAPTQPPERSSIPIYLTPRPKEQRPQPLQTSKPQEDRPTPEPIATKEQSRSQRDLVDGIIRSAIAETKADVAAPKMPTGIDRLDDLLAGGVPAGTMVLMSAEAYVGCDSFIHDIVSNALDEGRPVIYISTRRGIDEVYGSLSSRNDRIADYAATGLIKWIDLFSPAPLRVPFLQHVSTMRLEVTSMTEIFLQVDSRVSSGGVIIVDSASPLIARGKFEVFVRDIASCVKKIKGVAIFRIEAGMHTDQEIENLKNTIHACISFKKDGTKTLLMVEGIPDAKIGNWIEYQIKDGNIILGSFALERIS